MNHIVPDSGMMNTIQEIKSTTYIKYNSIEYHFMKLISNHYIKSINENTDVFLERSCQ